MGIKMWDNTHVVRFKYKMIKLKLLGQASRQTVIEI